MTLEPLADAQARVRAEIPVLEPQRVPIADALGRVLAEPIVTGEDVPPFANTAMDGYAVRAGDTAGATDQEPATLEVVGELPAGAAPDREVGAGEAIRIMTGAPVPDGADAIVPVEVTSSHHDEVAIRAEAHTGDHVRAAGGDVSAGDEVFSAGRLVAAAHVGVLASIGVESVLVGARPRVAVMSTGDELIERGPLRAGQIRDSNRPLLRALVAGAGAEAVDLGKIDDDEDAVRAALVRGLDCDAIVTTGGVSVGDYDYVKLVLGQLASERDGHYRWSQVAIKPAKPFAFGAIGGVPVFGLPGNPVSAHVRFELFARPALLAMAGHRTVDRPRVPATAEHDFGRVADGKLHLDRVVVSSDGSQLTARRSGVQASNVLSGMAGANGLALLPDGSSVTAGSEITVMLLDDPRPAD